MIAPEDVRLVVMTVDRSPAYIHGTLASIFASDPLAHRLAGVHLMVGTTEAGYLDGYRHQCRIDVRTMPSDEWERVRDWPTGRRFCHNYHRCLSIGLGDARGLCICEDDIVVRDGFVSKLLATVEEMEALHGLSRYLLSAYVPYRLTDRPELRRGSLFVSYPAPTFFGTQCMYYPRSVVDDVANEVQRDGVEQHLQPGDWIVRDYGVRINGIYGAAVSLAQHVGRQTTGLGEFHASPTFEEKFPLIPAELQTKTDDGLSSDCL